jgi:hypothetical protein
LKGSKTQKIAYFCKLNSTNLFLFLWLWYKVLISIAKKIGAIVRIYCGVCMLKILNYFSAKLCRVRSNALCWGQAKWIWYANKVKLYVHLCTFTYVHFCTFMYNWMWIFFCLIS